MPRKNSDPYDIDEEGRKAFEEDLKRVGETLPDEEVGIEGADVGEVVRHGKDSDEEARIKRRLADPHADVETETVKDFDL